MGDWGGGVQLKTPFQVWKQLYDCITENDCIGKQCCIVGNLKLTHIENDNNNNNNNY